MATSTTNLTRDPAFERFLGARVGDDTAGANVTVLSMFARLGVDPWDEASDLSRMKEAPAKKRLETLLGRFKDVPTLVSERGRLAVALLAFLPRGALPAKPVAQKAGLRIKLPAFGAPIYWIVFALLFLVWFVRVVQGY